MRPFVCLFALITAPGCASLWAVGKLGGADLEASTHETVVPVGHERQITLTGEYSPAAAVPPVEIPAPLPVPPPPYAPAPPIPPPPPRAIPPPPGAVPPTVSPGSVHFACMTKDRAPTLRIHEVADHYAPGWKALTVFMVISESALSAALLLDARGRHDAGEVVGGAFLGGDAVGSLLLLFKSEYVTERDLVREGDWSFDATCPDTLRVDAPSGPLPLARDGSLDPQTGEFAAAILAKPGGRLVVHDGAAAAELDPSPADRCGWARAHNVPSADVTCAGGPDNFGATLSAVLPVERSP